MKTLSIILSTVLLISCGKPESETYNATKAVVETKTNYVLIGDTFEAQVIPIDESISAMHTFNNDVNNVIHEQWENGVLKIKAKPTGMGVFKIAGTLNFNGPDKLTEIPFETEYIAVNPMPALITTFLIKDIENPLTVAVTGIPAENISILSTDVQIEKKGPSRYVVIPNITGKAVIKTIYQKGDIKKELSETVFEVVEKK